MSDNTQELREEWRNWLASHGLPHNEVEGDLILDFIEALLKSQTNQAVLEALDRVEKEAIRFEADDEENGFYDEGKVWVEAVPLSAIQALRKEQSGKEPTNE